MNATVLHIKQVLSQIVGSFPQYRRLDPIFLVTSNPETVGDTDFKLGTSIENSRYYQELIKDPRKVKIAEKPDGIILFEYPTKFALLDTNNKEVLYYMQYIRDRVLKTPSVTQIKVWSSPYSEHTTGMFESNNTLTSYVFFNHLLPKAKLIVTDRMQTSAGKRFWEKRIAQAFKLGLNVYGLDQNQHAVKKFASLKDWRAFADYFYGEENKFQGRKILISENNFKDKKAKVFEVL